MSDDFPYDVFLSHSSKDKSIVGNIAQRLRNDGVKVWFDEWEIKPGDDVSEKTEEGLKRSRIMVLCMSANAFGSDWAQLEFWTFRFRDPLNKDRRFLALRLDTAPIKGSLEQFSYISWLPRNSGQEYEKLREACLAALPLGPTAPTLPPGAQTARPEPEVEIRSLGHTGGVFSAAWSPDGTRALTGANDCTVRLWELESQRCLRVLEGHTSSIWSVAWSRDGAHVLSAASDKTLRLWELESGHCLRVLNGHSDSVLSVAWSPDGTRAVSGAKDKTVRLWDLKSGRCLRVLEGHTYGVNSVAWSPDGTHALSAASDKTLRLWDLKSGRCLRILENHTYGVNCVAWSPDGTRALSGGSDNTVRLWDLESGRCLLVLEGHTDSVLSVAWSPDGARALSGGADKTVRLWELASGRCLRVLQGHTHIVWSVAWSPDGIRALSGAKDNTLRLWELESGFCLTFFKGHTDSILSVARSPDGTLALTGANDCTVRLWELESGRCLRILKGHTDSVMSVAWSPDGTQAASGAKDNTVRLWELESGRCLRALEGHTDSVLSVAWSPDGTHALSGGADKTVRLWELASGRCLHVLRGHKYGVNCVAWSPDGTRALSAADDATVLLWELESGHCLLVLDGHTSRVCSVAWSPDMCFALSGGADQTVRLWETASGRCLRVLEGHTATVLSVAWSPDGTRVLSASSDKTVRLWELQSGRCLRILQGHTASILSVTWSPDASRAFSAAENGVWREWELVELPSPIPPSRISESPFVFDQDQTEYTNAKVLVVGDTHAGKTGLTHRLALGEWKPDAGSTVGAWSTQWPLKHTDGELDVDREIWLWDFGGQADQRLIHQLYMDRSALILLLFNADQEEVLPGLRDWLISLRRCVKEAIPHFLVAGRVDAGFKASRKKLQDFAKEQQLAYHETSAKSGEGCDGLKEAILSGIPWDRMEKRTSPRLFKLIKDEILKLRDEGLVLHTYKELRELLWQRLPDEPRFSDETLKTVIGLLDGPGVVKELNYGTYILLAPEWINAYAQAVIRTLRAADNELGALPLQSIADGKLIYQSIGRDGAAGDMKRLPSAEEKVVLGEMERQLEERGLCLRQGGKLVFPSHCGRDRPTLDKHPSAFMSYSVKGYLDDIYATLIVRLADCQAFKIAELWRDAADFVTLRDGKCHMGIKLVRDSASEGSILVYFGSGVTDGEQVIFANYIHDHLEGGCDEVKRLRHWVCPKCQTPKGNPEVLMENLLEEGEETMAECDRAKCRHRFPLWDVLEQRFASADVREKVERLKEQDEIRLDTRRKGKLLALEVAARIASADQKSFEIPGTEDEGIDIDLEFTTEGKGTGKRLYLQLKSGNSHLHRRADGTEVFRIKEQAWIQQWIQQAFPVMLVIGTFPEKEERGRGGKEKLEFAEVRWMEISSVLNRASANGTKPVTQIEFKGERLDLSSVRRWRDKILGGYGYSPL